LETVDGGPLRKREARFFLRRFLLRAKTLGRELTCLGSRRSLAFLREPTVPQAEQAYLLAEKAGLLSRQTCFLVEQTRFIA
jgi:hypothetical protein